MEWGGSSNLGSNSCFGTELVRLRSLTSQVGITPHALQAQLETRSSVNVNTVPDIPAGCLRIQLSP